MKRWRICDDGILFVDGMDLLSYFRFSESTLWLFISKSSESSVYLVH
jgi:hypothetical protein